MLKRILALISLVACCTAFAFLQRDYFTTNSFGTYDLTSPAYAEKDAAGNLYIIDAAREKLLRVNAGGQVDLILTSASHGFTELADLKVDTKGNIYALDIVRIGGSRNIDYERIIKFSPSGKLIDGEVYISQHETDFVNRKISQLVMWQCEFAFITLETNNFTLHSQAENGQWLQNDYAFPNARKMALAFATGPADELVFLTKRGDLYSVQQIGTHKLLYSTIHNIGSVPRGLTIAKDGTLMLTDLGARQICRLENGSLVPIYADEGERLTSSIYYRINAQNGLVAVSNTSVLQFDGDVPSFFESFPVSWKICLLRVSTLCLGIISGAGILVLLVILVRYILHKKNFVMTFSAAVMAGSLLLTSIFLLVASQNINQRITNEMMTRLLNVAQLTARLIPHSSLANLNEMQDYLDKDYLAVSGPIEQQVSL